jgi:hypothetical protein
MGNQECAVCGFIEKRQAIPVAAKHDPTQKVKFVGQDPVSCRLVQVNWREVHVLSALIWAFSAFRPSALDWGSMEAFGIRGGSAAQGAELSVQIGQFPCSYVRR